MAISRRKRSLRVQAHGSDTHNERYMWSRISQYLMRHVERFSIISTELMELACRILGQSSLTLSDTLMASVGPRAARKFTEELEDIEAYTEALKYHVDSSVDRKLPRELKSLPKEERRMLKGHLFGSGGREEEPAEGLFQPDADLSDFAEVVAKMTRKTGTKGARKIQRKLVQLLEQKVGNLKYPGKSDLEKNLASFAELFGLTVFEQELMNSAVESISLTFSAPRRIICSMPWKSSNGSA
jgi:hypothetical protein